VLWLLFAAAVLRCLKHERAYRPMWQLRQTSEAPRFVERSEVGYREPAVVSIEPALVPHAPRVVRWAALSSAVMGSAIVPGALIGLLGVIFFGIGLTSIPGLLVAGALWRSASPLLSGSLEGAMQAALAARWSLRLNWVILALCFLAVAVFRMDAAFLAGTTALYAMLSIAQAVLVARGALRSASEHGEEGIAHVVTCLPAYLTREERKVRVALDELRVENTVAQEERLGAEANYGAENTTDQSARRRL
jgi:hypothetical protein